MLEGMAEQGIGHPRSYPLFYPVKSGKILIAGAVEVIAVNRLATAYRSQHWE
jgi:hypothetical protein